MFRFEVEASFSVYRVRLRKLFQSGIDIVFFVGRIDDLQYKILTDIKQG